MKTKLFISMSLIIMTYGCTDMCRLTRDDKDWLLEEYKSLNYLENENKTIKVDIGNHFSTTWSKDGGWFPTGEGYESASSTLYLRDSLYWILINSYACENRGGVLVFTDTKFNYYQHPVAGFQYYKDSLTNNTVTVLGKEYKNCFVYQDSTYIKDLTFVKNYGIVKIEFRDGYKLELIP